MNKENSINSYRIRRTSRRFIRILQFLMITVPLIDCAIWFFMNDLLAPMRHEILPAYVRFPLPPMARFLGWCVSLLPLAVFLYGSRTLIALFRLYEQGRIFSRDNVRCFSRLSQILIAWCMVSILVEPLQSIALTLHYPQGQQTLYLGLNSTQLTILLIGGILAVISWVMEEGRQIKEEQELTI